MEDMNVMVDRKTMAKIIGYSYNTIKMMPDSALPTCYRAKPRGKRFYRLGDIDKWLERGRANG